MYIRKLKLAIEKYTKDLTCFIIAQVKESEIIDKRMDMYTKKKKNNII